MFSLRAFSSFQKTLKTLLLLLLLLKIQVNLPAILNTARSAGSNWRMLKGLSLAHSFRDSSISKSIVDKIKTQ